VIVDEAAFHGAVRLAATAAEQGKLVTFGVVPTGPETGYGYIKATAQGDIREVDAFVEKPDASTARDYVAAGTYFWNSGMFVFKASVYLDQLARLQPEILSASTRAFEAARQDDDFIRIEHELFSKCPSNSIDYAVMERTESATVVPFSAG